jgi:hypothetical protein
VRKFQFAGEKAWWEIKSSDTIMIDDVEYVKLPRAGVNIGFTRLVVEGCSSVPDPLPKGFSLTQSRGYRTLVQLRNTAQSNDLLAEHNARIPEMFRASAKKAKNVRLTKDRIMELKEHPDVVWIIIPPCGSYTEPTNVAVKRPLHAREDLAVQCEGCVLQHIIEFIRSEGFDETLQRPKSLPRGIYRKDGHKYPLQYAYVDSNGKRCRHFAASMDDAVNGVDNGPPRNIQSDDVDHSDQLHDGNDGNVLALDEHTGDIV